MDGELLVARSAGDDSIDRVVAALAPFGLTAPAVRVAGPRRTLGGLEWALLLSLPLQAFLSAVGARLGEDAYRVLKSSIVDLCDRSATPRIVLRDAETGLRVELDGGLDDESVRKLAGTDLSAYPGTGILRYDRDTRRWALHDE